ncbi:hypothetical protein TK0555 [Thermococcus kodakarensis KOD1]|uniref:Uncharacterized protein n=1 Tax=Thermococcus kodakarensis (strain ATCC BAA-918 / JCM 12380 / KOD1) TaxID=69014 RepID=Q5JF44_THEKO|nr:hypothetical protein [Thermococcus kodakarensis]WCN28605.1 hypothetical protein POG15_02850 [Thermococcus kodakarensis]WCN30903.1 hypothetical protein POG21_02850 [Thermococcus kodakarensis]BAD84744.1 hypothetical protein TK0555 [Thermococcus kodakarensis KOD1]
MIVRGRILGAGVVAPFEVRKDERGLYVRVELPDKLFEHSIDCPCLEPLEFLGLLLPALEEELGEVKGVFVEKVEKEKHHSLLKSFLRFLSKGGHTTP